MKTTFTFLKGSMSLICLLFCLSQSVNLHAEEDAVFSLICPGDYWVDCDDEIWNLSIYGNAYYHDYTGSHSAGAPYVVYNLNSCNVGTITRTWTVEDYNWNVHTCTQTIYVSSNGSFTGSNIHWPEEHLDLEGCNPNTDPYSLPYGYGPPTYDYVGCSLIGKSYKDQQFWFGPTCKKIIRKWTIIDWCQYNPNTYGSSGIWVYYQFIKISTADIPVLSCPEVVDGKSYNCTNAVVEVAPIEVDGNACGGYFEITNDSPYAYEDGADISGVYPIGTTKVKVSVHYGCSKTKTCLINVVVKDSKGPTPYCLATIATALMPIDDNEDGIPEDGMVEIWAKDLDFGSYSTCHPGPLKFSFSSDVNDKFRVYTCDQVGENEEQMWVTDIKGNQSWCKVIIDVQNNSANIPDCEPVPGTGGDDGEDNRFSARGSVMSPNLKPIELVFMTLVNQEAVETYEVINEPEIIIHFDTIINSSGFVMINEWHDTISLSQIDTIQTYIEMLEMTGNDGAFIYDNMLAENGNYKLSGHFEDDGRNGIGEEDIQMLMAHLIGNKIFESPYQYIAADTDDNGQIDFDDLRNLLYYVTGQLESLPTENPWVILDASATFDFPESAIKEECPTTLNLEAIHESMEGLDFYAIKKGDLTYDAAISNGNKLKNIAEIENIIQSIENNADVETELNIRNYLDGIDKLTIVPNPFDERLKLIYLSTSDQSLTLQVNDISGRVIAKYKYQVVPGENQIEIPTTELNSGIYLYQVHTSNEMYSGKVIKK